MKAAIVRYEGITKELLEFCSTTRTLEEIANQFFISENIAWIFLSKLSEVGELGKRIYQDWGDFGEYQYESIECWKASIPLEEYLRSEHVSDDLIEVVIESIEEAKSNKDKWTLIHSAVDSPHKRVILDYAAAKRRRSEVQRGLIDFLIDANRSVDSINSILAGLMGIDSNAEKETRRLLTKQGVSVDVIDWILSRMILSYF